MMQIESAIVGADEITIRLKSAGRFVHFVRVPFVAFDWLVGMDDAARKLVVVSPDGLQWEGGADRRLSLADLVKRFGRIARSVGSTRMEVLRA